MPHSPAKLFEDVLLATHEVEGFREGKTLSDFKQDRQFQLAVERELEIVGEALFRLRKTSPGLFECVTDAEKIIGLRNILAHGYDILDYEILWDVVSNKLPALERTIIALQRQDT